ncbi:MAG: endonuclease [Paludibacteraceae bacterium]|nr:endonuclease [Paludibacteraceae bacterium]
MDYHPAAGGRKSCWCAIALSLLILLPCPVSSENVTPAKDLPSYYAAVNSQSGVELFKKISAISIVGYTSLGYDGLKTAYLTTDVYPKGHARAGQIWDMYGECGAFKSGACGSYKNECDCWNREHSIPKSWFGEKTANAGCDIFHVVPTDGKVNNARGNLDFGEVGSNVTYSYNGNKVGTSVASVTTARKTIATVAGGKASASGLKVYEPLDEYKGDFARGYFGTLVRWYTKYDFTQGNSTFSCVRSVSASNYFGFTAYGVALLMKWHREDPVSQKEIDRNNGIQQTQGNRNPFIDYPYLAEYIWGERNGERVDMAHLISSSDARFIPGESSGWIEDITAVDETLLQPQAQKVLINGQIYIRLNEQLYNITGQPVTIDR